MNFAKSAARALFPHACRKFSYYTHILCEEKKKQKKVRVKKMWFIVELIRMSSFLD